MANAVTARWHGDNYQSRIFWENAFNLLDDHSCVVEVTFEADGPKSFDDVVVKYDPPVVRSGPDRVAAEYHQIKWHVETGGRFGYEDFIDPDFIGAQSFSLLQRLKEAREKLPQGQNAHFSFLTTYRIKDGDPLAELVSGHDRSLLIERLFDGTTDRSRMGKVRKLWREHLELPDDSALKAVIGGFRIIDGHRSLDELRSEINIKAKVVGVMGCSAAASDFRYDELARQLKIRQLNGLTRETLLKLCGEEGLLLEKQQPKEQFLPVAIRSFLGPAADIVGATPENSLILTDAFRQRYLQDGRDWQADIRPRVTAFLGAAVKKSPKLRLILDAHASIAFLAGAVLDVKSGVSTELVQKGRVGTRIWQAGDGTTGLRLEMTEQTLGQGSEIAVGISIAQQVGPHVRRYVDQHVPNVGKLVTFAFSEGPGHQNVAGGGHAAALAEQIATSIRSLRDDDPDGLVHIFAACPNSLLFFMGQHHQGIAPCVVYEFDFDRQGNKSYQPSFVID
ncbi:SAVED domain-containing protein [Brucella pseudogrignonensis]|uniref:SAVED domain-containing protein n=1 Tax=Brucella pseudogrignonensis TaxID=419475 RepID=UPI00124CA0BE|nr:SAVED domain-containing protein [Brucella pseudogrignonensis]KAB2688799.1 SAVED domain-containing protein [Brucella pseudogrignonensis]